MKRRFFCVLLLVSSVAHALPPHKTIACGIIIAKLRDMTWMRSAGSEDSAQAMRSLHMFHVSNYSGVDGVDAGIPTFYLDDAKGKKVRSKKVVSRILGLKEQISNNPDENVLSIKTSIVGREAIKDFQSELVGMMNEGVDVWKARFKDKYGVRAIKGVTLSGLALSADGAMGTSTLEYVGPTLLVLAQLESAAMQGFFMDHRIAPVLNSIGDIDNRKVGQNLMWSQNYEIGKHTRDVLLGSTPQHKEMRNDILATDALSDDKGIAGYILGAPGGTPNRRKFSGEPSWVGVDMMIRWDGGEPVLSVVVRYADHQPQFKKSPAKQESKELVPELELAPVQGVP
jgi:hypothetical protein